MEGVEGLSVTEKHVVRSFSWQNVCFEKKASVNLVYASMLCKHHSLKSGGLRSLLIKISVL